MSATQFARRLGAARKEWRLLSLRFAADRLFGNYRLTWHQIDWWDDPEFNRFLERFGERGGFNSQRRWTVWQLLRLIESVPGDTAECGVWRGAGSWLICAATRRQGRTHHLFDSFEGLSAPEAVDGTHWKAGDMSVGEEIVRENLRPFADSIVAHRGWIPDRFADVADRKFAFVHVDVDLRQPTLDSVEFFYPRLSPGAILVCDDYGCSTCPGATEAIDGFLADKPEKMVALDSGGGFFIKGTATADRGSPLAQPAAPSS